MMILMSAIHSDWSASDVINYAGSGEGNHMGRAWLCGGDQVGTSPSGSPFTRIGTDARSPEPGHTSDDQKFNQLLQLFFNAPTSLKGNSLCTHVVEG